MALSLVIGNKNYSSWSMRPWVLMRQLGIPFEERRLRFDFGENSAFRQAVARVSPAGLVPVLIDDDPPGRLPVGAVDEPGLAVWDTLSIVEYLHEHAGRDPASGPSVWPADARRRARARSLCAEMHGGFGALRQNCPMNIEASLPEVGARVWREHAAVRHDLGRIEAAWRDALHASGGPFLFGEFSAADAYYAPVAMRVLTYALPLGREAAAYVARVAAAPGVAAWIAEARAEHDFLDFEEPYRSAADAAMARGAGPTGDAGSSAGTAGASPGRDADVDAVRIGGAPGGPPA